MVLRFRPIAVPRLNQGMNDSKNGVKPKVSVLKLPQLRQGLGIPHHILPVAYLCLGYPAAFPDQLLLQTVGWREPMSIHQLLHFDTRESKGETQEWLDFRQTLLSTSEDNYLA